MASLSREELIDLANVPGPCVSIYMPVQGKWNDAEQDPIRLKTLVHEAERGLALNGYPTVRARELLAPAAQMASSAVAWRKPGGTLAYFLAPGFERRYRLPARINESVCVQDKFQFKPLLSLLGGDESFFVLAVSVGNLRLIHGGPQGTMEVDLNHLPRSLEESLADRDPDEQLQIHSATSGRRGRVVGKQGGVFHSQGTGLDDRIHKRRILQHFEEVDRGLREVLGTTQAPLILAGVEYVRTLYRQANRYPYLVEAGIEGSPDRRRSEELAEEGRRILEPGHRRAREQAVEAYRTAVPRRQASSDLWDVVPAATVGRVGTLFVPEGAERWGRFDRENMRVEIHDAKGPGREDLINLAALHTFLNRGTVYVVPPEDMPEAASVAAVFRY